MEVEEAAVVVIGSEVDVQSPGLPQQEEEDTVSLQAPGPAGEAGLATDSAPRDRRESEDATNSDRLQRFYFESDALVLKNNIE